MTRRPLLALLVLALGACLAGCAATTLPAVHSETERLSLARRMMDQHRWASAIELLKSYVENNAGSAQVDQARYLLGMSYLRNRDWALASTEFELMIREYPESDSTPSAAYQLGEALFAQARPPDFDQEHTNQAINQWRTYLDTYPGHWLNPEAQRQLNLARSRLATKLIGNGELYLSLHLHGPARVYFERVRDEYGDTLLLPRALLGLAMCDVLSGHRAEAVAQLKEIETRFPGRAEAARAARERARLQRKHDS